MKLANLSDKDRIKILKILVLMGAAGSLLNLYYLKKTVDNIVELGKRHDRNIRKMRVAGKIIDDLMKHADPDVLEEIVRKYEFDWVIADVAPDEIDPDGLTKQ
jgi:hypothetical protein